MEGSGICRKQKCNLEPSAVRRQFLFNFCHHSSNSLPSPDSNPCVEQCPSSVERWYAPFEFSALKTKSITVQYQLFQPRNNYIFLQTWNLSKYLEENLQTWSNGRRAPDPEWSSSWDRGFCYKKTQNELILQVIKAELNMQSKCFRSWLVLTMIVLKERSSFFPVIYAKVLTSIGIYVSVQ